MKKQTLALLSLVFLFTACKKNTVEDNRIKDADGNVYTEVTIGTQTWLLENLKTTKYRNGDPILNITDNTQWLNAVAPAYCNYENNPALGNAEGRLYNWFAAIDERNICPPGYHIPSLEEYNLLIAYLGGSAVAGDKLKNTGTNFWGSPNTGSNNQSGFTANAMGLRHAGSGGTGNFLHRLQLSMFWASTPVTTPGFEYLARYLHLQNDLAEASVSIMDKKDGLSIRCIKD